MLNLGTSPRNTSSSEAATSDVRPKPVSREPDTPPRSTSPSEAATGDVGIRFAAADRDRGGWWVKDAEGLTWLSNPEFLSPGRFADFDLLLVEAAHLIARADPPQSKAQVFTADELENWRPGCPVRTVKELHAKKRRDSQGIDGKLNGADAIALYGWAEKSLAADGWDRFRDRTRRFPFRQVPSWLTEIIEDCNRRQNTARYWDYSDPESQRALEIAGTILTDPVLNPLRNSKVAEGKASKAKLKAPYVYVAYVALFDAEGNLRRDPHGRPISNRTLRRILGLAGDAPRSVARGKIQHDLFGSGLGKSAGAERAARARSDEYRSWRRRCECAMMALVQTMRDTSPPHTSPSEAATGDARIHHLDSAAGTSPRSMSPSEAATREVRPSGPIFTEGSTL